ncbi:MAG TPA: peptidylprolyl isomerase [Candidatus Limnocylindrales bacterium]|nr:peptidylprolyl isomerase [Candidatus Limnocylindrales bacterium]
MLLLAAEATWAAHGISNSGRDIIGLPWEIHGLMKLLLPICALSLCVGLGSAWADEPKSDAKAGKSNEVAVIKTSEGDMVIEFWPDVAPKTVENFKTLAKKGFYDGTCFHRVIKGFMIQGGDPLTKDASQEERWGTGGPGYNVKAEFNDRHHDRGVISMARSSDPDSAGSQFFICHGSPRQLDHQYTAFGKLIKGEDVLEKIATTPTHRPDRPDKRMAIESIKIVPADSAK